MGVADVQNEMGAADRAEKTWRKEVDRREQGSLETMAHAMSTLLYVKINCSTYTIPIFYQNK